MSETWVGRRARHVAKLILGPAFERSGTVDVTYGEKATIAVQMLVYEFAHRAVGQLLYCEGASVRMRMAPGLEPFIILPMADGKESTAIEAMGQEMKKIISAADKP